MNFGRKIKSLRMERGWNAEELAERCGVSPATIYRYERGSISSAPVDKIAPIADALGVSPAVIMGWDDYAENGQEVKNDYAAGIAARTVRTPKTQTRKKTEIDEIIDRLLIYQNENVISPDEQRLLDLYRLLTDKQKEKAIKIIDAIGDD